MITDRMEKDDVRVSPFPHVVLRDVLDAGLCEQLMSERPAWTQVVGDRPAGNNVRFNYVASQILADPEISPTWKAFARQHTSQEFLQSLLELFRDQICEAHPQLGSRLDDLKAGIRNHDNFANADVLLDAQFGINTPVNQMCSVRGPHLDSPHKLFAGLLYLRTDEDDSTGGELQLCSRKDNHLLDVDYELPTEHAKVEQTVPYARNTLALFLNTPGSFHGVTPRSVTSHPRIFINFVVEMKEPVFYVERQRRKSFLKRLFTPSFARSAA